MVAAGAVVLPVVLAYAQASESLLPPSSPIVSRALLAIVVVLGLLAAWAWLLHRGTLKPRRHGPVSIETAVTLGDKRSLVVVCVEGRRLLLGVTPANVSVVTALQPEAEFSEALDRAASDTDATGESG